MEDIVDSPILLAEEVCSDADNKFAEDWFKDPDHYEDSTTWVFYKLSTIKGSVTMRWLGESNGYYGERAYFEEITK